MTCPPLVFFNVGELEVKHFASSILFWQRVATAFFLLFIDSFWWNSIRPKIPQCDKA